MALSGKKNQPMEGMESSRGEPRMIPPGLSQFPSSAPGGSTRLSCGAGDAQLVLSQLSRQASPRGPRAGVFSFAAHTTRNQSSAAPGEDVMANLSLRELLLLTCIGTFIASATYAVTLLH